ncbi:YqaJ viral recombinase family nuclease [Paenibacillus tarimensis]|uniref:YqaJ viral recombinase family nuclease n=1 Tax=Paenibacillus tarimensis TaxID=416012 RepID=UPI001F309F9B|nr:YqaJ viral recombinase family protein [Paenibacillus tarimensis]MCF2945600.1 YqaJ viral recombinase family protein [Paenibacillus tarimensis]
MGASIVTHTRLMSAEERAAWRRTGIGGSDIAAVLGMNPWKTALEVYLEKIGESQREEPTEKMKLGLSMKGVIARQFSEQTGLRTLRRNMIYAHSQHRHLIASVDRWVVGDGAGLLCKSTGEYSNPEWDGGKVPLVTLLQCQHYMAVMGADHWWVAALVGGNKLKIVRVERDEAAIQRIIRQGLQFWEGHVKAGHPPELDGSEGAVRLLRKQFPADDSCMDSCKLLPREAEDWIAKYREAEAEEKAAFRRKTEAENRLKQMLGQYERGKAGGVLVEWRTVRSRTGNRQHYRRFRLTANTTMQETE